MRTTIGLRGDLASGIQDRKGLSATDSGDDPTGGGTTHRAGGGVEWQRTTAAGMTRVEGYGFDYGLDLFSNFTYFLDDPEPAATRRPARCRRQPPCVYCLLGASFAFRSPAAYWTPASTCSRKVLSAYTLSSWPCAS